MKTSKGNVILVSPQDLALASQYNWGETTKYPSVRHKGELIFLHNLVMGTPPSGYCVDHINNNTFDCRRENLRIIRKGHNTARGVRPNNISGRVGVHETRHGTWCAQLSLPRGKTLSKSFKTFIQAVQQRESWEIFYFGEVLC